MLFTHSGVLPLNRNLRGRPGDILEIGVIGVKPATSEQSGRIADVLSEQADRAEHQVRVHGFFMCENHLERRRIPVGEGMIENQDTRPHPLSSTFI